MHVHIKATAKRTQGRRDVLDAQLGERIFENATMDTAYLKMEEAIRQNNVLDVDSDSTTTPGSENFSFSSTTAVARLDFAVDQNGHLKLAKGEKIPSFVTQEALQTLKNAVYNGKIPGNPAIEDIGRIHSFEAVSEIKWKNQIIRASKKYKNNQTWYDWVMIRYRSDRKATTTTPRYISYPDCDFEASRHQYAPGKIIGFFLNPYEEESASNLYAVLEMCDFDGQKNSIFTTKWKTASAYDENKKKIPYYEIVRFVEHVVRPCLMIPHTLGDSPSSYHEVWPTELWADEFHVV
jgi:hypothetical protein